MLVYADAKRTADPRALLRALREHAARRGADRTTLLLEAGELAQGIIDHAWQSSAEIDEWSPLVERATALVRACAEAFVGDDERPIVIPPFDELELPERVSVSLPEGFAFYAVYPQAWARLAEQHRNAPTRVIGIRSIGLTLGAVVAAAARAQRFASVRPSGHPFDRTLAIGSALGRALLEHNEGVGYLVVDEGPGRSGSSFASVARWLTAHGVAVDRIVFMPSHAGGPGPDASDQVRRIWAAVRTQVPGAPPVLERFAGCEDLSGGAWRGVVYGAHAWPPASPQQERLKLLSRDHGAPRLAKFAGLGRYGADKLALAQTLANRGWTPQPIALTDGFLIREWLPHALPLDHPAAVVDRAALLRRVADYIAFRGTNLPAEDCPRASVHTLFRMLQRNVEQALGPALRRRFDVFERSLGHIETHLHPCRTDNRMHRWEWLTTPGGTLIKADALDHHATHDLIGAQDPLWDLVGARHELALDDDQFTALRDRVARALGRDWSDTQVSFFSAAYLAFQCGAATLAADVSADPDALRLRKEARRYAKALTTIAPSGP